MNPCISRLEPRREVLANGLTLLWNTSHDSPSVAIRGSFGAGACRERPEQAGLASLTARLLRRGTESRSAREIAGAVEDIGASFLVWAGTEEAGFSAKCLARDTGLVLEILREVLERPAFRVEELEKTREEVLVQLAEQEDSTRARAERAVQGMLYPPEHPYARASVGTRETVSALSREDIRCFHAAWYAASGMRVSIAGAIDPKQLRSRLECWLADRPAPPEYCPPPPGGVQANCRPPRDPARLTLPHKSQADLIIAGRTIPRAHPDYFALTMANMVLGSLGLMGRLGDRLREREGMAYHASSRSLNRLWAGEWMAVAGVAPRNVEPAIEAILDEAERLRDGGVSAEELDDARDALIGSLPLRMETNDGIANYMLSTEYYDLGLDYVNRYPGLVRAETRESLLRAARKHLDPARFCAAVAGPV